MLLLAFSIVDMDFSIFAPAAVPILPTSKVLKLKDKKTLVRFMVRYTSTLSSIRKWTSLLQN
jgi:hypothetical protein